MRAVLTSLSLAILITQLLVNCNGFVLTSKARIKTFAKPQLKQTSSRKRHPSHLFMNIDPITSLRTEWVSAALCTNQTPKSADVALQLGCNDGRAVMFLPRTIRKIITSSNEADGKINVSIQRQLNQQKSQRYGGNEAFGEVEVAADRVKLDIIDQRADDLKNVEDESVDVVISLQSAEIMSKNGLDWKKSIQEAVRVLKPEGRLLFVEKTELGYLDYLVEQEGLIWESIGYDDIDLVIVPHVAGVAIKSVDAGLSPEEREQKVLQLEKDRKADVAISAFEGGRKRRRKKKKDKDDEPEN